MNICNLAQEEMISIFVESNHLDEKMTFDIKKDSKIIEIKEVILKKISEENFVNACSLGSFNSKLYLCLDENQDLQDYQIQDGGKFYIHFDKN